MTHWRPASQIVRDFAAYHDRTVADAEEGAPWRAVLDKWPGLAHLLEQSQQYAKGPTEPPATNVGEVNFADLLTTDAHWSLKNRFDRVLGRPYLSTQLAALLPADVAYRLSERLEHLVEEAVRREVDKIHDDVQTATAETLSRMATATDKKLEELRNERYKPTRLG